MICAAVSCKVCMSKGADKGYLFTGEGGAVAYVGTQNLNAFDCIVGLETECPTPLGETAPFMQANTFGVRLFIDCETGIRLGGGQQNHSRVVINAGEIGACRKAIHVDGDDDGKRLAYQLDGQGWFEQNDDGNIVMDAGTLYITRRHHQQRRQRARRLSPERRQALALGARWL